MIIGTLFLIVEPGDCMPKCLSPLNYSFLLNLREMLEGAKAIWAVFSKLLESLVIRIIGKTFLSQIDLKFLIVVVFILILIFIFVHTFQKWKKDSKGLSPIIFGVVSFFCVLLAQQETAFAMEAGDANPIPAPLSDTFIENAIREFMLSCKGNARRPGSHVIQGALDEFVIDKLAQDERVELMNILSRIKHAYAMDPSLNEGPAHAKNTAFNELDAWIEAKQDSRQKLNTRSRRIR